MTTTIPVQTAEGYEVQAWAIAQLASNADQEGQ